LRRTVPRGANRRRSQSADWLERQRKKILAGTAGLSRLIGDRDWFTPRGFRLG
jgi:hypothetical protein